MTKSDDERGRSFLKSCRVKFHPGCRFYSLIQSNVSNSFKTSTVESGVKALDRFTLFYKAPLSSEACFTSQRCIFSFSLNLVT